MKLIHFFIVIFLLLMVDEQAVARTKSSTSSSGARRDNKALQCIAFSPYVGKINPNYGPQPSKELIERLLDRIVKETSFRCIMTYGVISGLESIFAAAEARHIKVIAILWIDKDATVNSQSIANGIRIAKAFPETIIKLSCGSEVRTRHGYTYDGEITRCINTLREAKVKQPITTIDTWWEWCNRSSSCGPTSFSAQVDWVGINVFPWWENRFSGLYPCVSADKAADFHLARLNEVKKANPDKEVIITEFGWPNGPLNGTETNIKTGQHCGIASPDNQALVIQSTFKKLAEQHYSGVVFEAFSENWKPSDEGNFGSYWGICNGEPPYTCSKKATHH